MILGQLQNNTPHTNQRAKQDEFWKVIIEQYNEQITALQDEKLARSEVINTLEVALLPYISFKIAQLSEEDLRNNVDRILGLEEQSSCGGSCKKTQAKDKENIPDLSDISVFSIDDADVHYMDIIKDYIADEKLLRKEITKLKQEYKALKDKRIEVKELLGARKESTKFDVDANLMRSLNLRLVEQNSALKQELEALKLYKTSTSSVNIRTEIDNYRKIISATQEKLDKYKNRSWHTDSLQSCQNMTTKIQGINKQVEEQRMANEQLQEQIYKLSGFVRQLQNQLIVKKLHEFEEM